MYITFASAAMWRTFRGIRRRVYVWLLWRTHNVTSGLIQLSTLNLLLFQRIAQIKQFLHAEILQDIAPELAVPV